MKPMAHVIAVAAMCAITTQTLADGDHLDGWFGFDNDSGAITFLGGATVLGGEIDQTFPGLPIYERLFGDDGLPVNETEIGFAAFDGVFDPFQALQINFVDALLFWDGAGEVDFATTTATAQISFGPQSASSTTGPFAGAITFTADDEGGFHGDMDVELSGDALAGVYLMQLSLSFDDSLRGLLGESQTSYWVMGFGVDDAIVELAVEAIEGQIPTPGALCLLAVCLVGPRRCRNTRTAGHGDGQRG